MTKTRNDARPKLEGKNVSSDKIEDKWRPATVVVEPGQNPEIYHTGRKLGKGGFAVCFEGTLKRTGQVFALKVVKSYVDQRKQLEKVCLTSRAHERQC